jgi:hypothetical protein
MFKLKVTHNNIRKVEERYLNDISCDCFFSFSKMGDLFVLGDELFVPHTQASLVLVVVVVNLSDSRESKVVQE